MRSLQLECALSLQVSKSTTKLVVMCIWLGSMLLSAPPLFGINRFVYEVHTMSGIYTSTYLLPAMSRATSTPAP